MPQIWKDIYLTPEFIDQIKSTKTTINPAVIKDMLERLLAGETAHGDGCEHLQGTVGYACRLNLKDRLRYITLTIIGKNSQTEKYLVPTDIILEHKYKRAKHKSADEMAAFLTKALGHPMTKTDGYDYILDISKTQSDSLLLLKCGFQHVFDNDVISIEDKQASESSGDPLARHFHYGTQWIELNPIQNAIADSVERSMQGIISGVPGAGKTVLAYHAIRYQYQQAKKAWSQQVSMTVQEEDDEAILKPILYICTADVLCANMIKNLGGTVNLTDPKLPKVICMTYQQFLVENCQIQPEQFATQRTFEEWHQTIYLLTVIKHAIDIIKSKPPQLDPLIRVKATISKNHSSHELYHQLRHYSNEFTQDPAVIKNSQPLEKQALFDIYQSYMAYLESQHQIDPAFFILPEIYQHQYLLGTVDEAQNFSKQQLQNIADSVENNQIFFYLDSHQSIVNVESNFSFLITLLERSPNFDRHQQIYYLPHSHRCSQLPIQYMNGLLKLKYTLFSPDEKNQYQQLEANADNQHGIVEILDASTFESNSQYQALAEHEGTAVIVADQQTRDILSQNQKYRSFLQIFTLSGAQGLEYQTIIVHGLLEPLIKLAELLKKCDINDSSSIRALRKAHPEIIHDDLLRAINTIYVAWSRTMHQLIIVETDAVLKRLEPNLIPFIRSMIRMRPINPSLAENLPTPVKSSESNWMRRMEELIAYSEASGFKQSEELESAALIFTEQLHRGNRSDFEQWLTTKKAAKASETISSESDVSTSPELLSERIVDGSLVFTDKPISRKKGKKNKKSIHSGAEDSKVSAVFKSAAELELQDRLSSINAKNLLDVFFHGKDPLIKHFNHHDKPDYIQLTDLICNWLEITAGPHSLFTSDSLLSFGLELIKTCDNHAQTIRLQKILAIIILSWIEDIQKQNFGSKNLPKNLISLLPLAQRMLKSSHPHDDNSLIHYAFEKLNSHTFFTGVIGDQLFQIPAPVWFTPFSANSRFCGQIPLIILCKALVNDTRKVTQNIISLVQKLIIPQNLCDFIPPPPGAPDNICTRLMSLLQAPYERSLSLAILHRIVDLEYLRKNPANSSIWHDFLITLDKLPDLSILHHLYEDVEGFDLLTRLSIFAKYDFATNIVVSDKFFNRSIINLGSDQNNSFSTFYSLAETKESRDFLGRLPLIIPQFIKYVEPKVLVANQQNYCFLNLLIGSLFSRSNHIATLDEELIILIHELFNIKEDITPPLKKLKLAHLQSPQTIEVPWIDLLYCNKKHQKQCHELIIFLLKIDEQNDQADSLFYPQIEKMMRSLIEKNFYNTQIEDWDESVLNVLLIILNQYKLNLASLLLYAKNSNHKVEPHVLTSRFTALFVLILHLKNRFPENESILTEHVYIILRGAGRHDIRLLEKYIFEYLGFPPSRLPPRIEYILEEYPSSLRTLEPEMDIFNSLKNDIFADKLRQLNNSNFIDEFFGRAPSNQPVTRRGKPYCEYLDVKAVREATADMLDYHLNPYNLISINLEYLYEIIDYVESLQDSSFQRVLRTLFYPKFLNIPSIDLIDFLSAMNGHKEKNYFLMSWLKEELEQIVEDSSDSLLHTLLEAPQKNLHVLTLIHRMKIKIPDSNWFVSDNTVCNTHTASMPIFKLLNKIIQYGYRYSRYSSMRPHNYLDLIDFISHTAKQLKEIPNGLISELHYEPVNYFNRNLVNLTIALEDYPCSNLNLLDAILTINPHVITKLPSIQWFISEDPNNYPLLNLFTTSAAGNETLKLMLKQIPDYTRDLFQFLGLSINQENPERTFFGELIYRVSKNLDEDGSFSRILSQIKHYPKVIQEIGIEAWIPHLDMCSGKAPQQLVQFITELLCDNNPVLNQLIVDLLIYCPDFFDTTIILNSLIELDNVAEQALPKDSQIAIKKWREICSSQFKLKLKIVTTDTPREGGIGDEPESLVKIFDKNYCQVFFKPAEPQQQDAKPTPRFCTNR